MLVDALCLFGVQRMLRALQVEFRACLGSCELNGDGQATRLLLIQRHMVGQDAGQTGLVGLSEVAPELMSTAIDFDRDLCPYPDSIGLSALLDGQRQQSAQEEAFSVEHTDVCVDVASLRSLLRGQHEDCIGKSE